LLGAPSYRLFDAGSFQGPTLYSALGARWRPNAPTSYQFVHAELSAAIRSQAFDFSPTQQADLNLLVLSLSSCILCDGNFYSPLSGDTRKTLPYCVYTAMVTLNGDLPRRLDQSIAQYSNWLASIQSLPAIRLLACLDCALRAVTKK